MTNFSPKAGGILERNFGSYPASQNGQFSTTYYGGRIPPEMIKNRLVVVLDGRINDNICIVVPLSTVRDCGKLNRGAYVGIANNAVNGLQLLDQQIRWAKADLVQQVSRDRLNRAKTYEGHLNQCLPHGLVVDIQRAATRSINAISLVN